MKTQPQVQRLYRACWDYNRKLIIGSAEFTQPKLLWKLVRNKSELDSWATDNCGRVFGYRTQFDTKPGYDSREEAIKAFLTEENRKVFALRANAEELEEAIKKVGG